MTDHEQLLKLMRAAVLTAFDRIVATASDERVSYAERVGRCREIAEISASDLRCSSQPMTWPPYESDHAEET